MLWHNFCIIFREIQNQQGINMKKFLKSLKRVNGQSLAEFAVTTAMMATLATTAAPKFSGVGEGAKEKKTLADIDKIMKAANNFYNTQVTESGVEDFLDRPNSIKMFLSPADMEVLLIKMDLPLLLMQNLISILLEFQVVQG